MNIHLIEPDAKRSASLQRLLMSLGHFLKNSPEKADVCLVSDSQIVEVRQIPSPCIVVSSQGTTAVAASAFELGAVDFLRYPVYGTSLNRALSGQPSYEVSPTVAHSFPLPSRSTVMYRSMTAGGEGGNTRVRERHGRMESVPGIGALPDDGLEKVFNVQKPHTGAGKACRVQVPKPTIQVIRALASVWGNTDGIALLERSSFWEALCGEVLLTWLWEHERLPKERVIIMSDVSPGLYQWIEAVTRRKKVLQSVVVLKGETTVPQVGSSS